MYIYIYAYVHLSLYKLHPEGKRTLKNLILRPFWFEIWESTLWGSTLWGSALWGSTLSHLPIWEFGTHLPVLKKHYRGPFNVNVV